MKQTVKKSKKVKKLVIGEVEKVIAPGTKADPLTCAGWYCELP